MNPVKGIVFISVIFSSFLARASSDTLRISVQDADGLFLKNNYNLLASSMNIDAQRAQIIQAGLYPNPVFTGDFNAIDPENSKVAHLGKSGQKFFQLEQLILLGGKRKAQIELASTNVKIAELEFQDMIRQLKFQLHTSLYFLNQQTFLINKYNKQLELLETILSAYDTQVKKGNIPLKDMVRLKGVYLNLNNNKAEALKEYFGEMAKVKTILQTDSFVIPNIPDTNIEQFSKEVGVAQLNELAFQNRPDYLITQQNVTLAEQYFQFQKTMAKPDINVFTSYDQRSGAFRNQVNVGVSIPIPVWNKNQGNIKSAMIMKKQQEYTTEAFKAQLLAEIHNYHAQFIQSLEEYQKYKKLYNEDFDLTLAGITENFKKGNVSMIEFVDFFEAYNDALAEIAKIKINLATSAEQLNLSTGKQVF
ncbi:TolC family protein [Emticicia sp. CRIBPO]|uniref:TolC family protein n=1 Tax=Emticicia sp. CRIBPO TaxID=2683258 RepID=UPI001411C1FC|nr:TolC family protein [Emticicia sp. CRIBPO]NBA85604.1 TolC family protein [Emticicia sp. CRIBPO]